MYMLYKQKINRKSAEQEGKQIIARTATFGKMR